MDRTIVGKAIFRIAQVLAVSAAIALLPPPAQAAGGHRIAITARVLGHCKVDSGFRENGSTNDSAPPKLSCSRIAGKPMIESAREIVGTAGKQVSRTVDAFGPDTRNANGAVVTVLF